LAETRRWRWGKKRWVVFGLIALNVLAAQYYWPVAPHVAVAPEKILHDPLFTMPFGWGNFYLINTFTAMLIVDLVVILMALSFKRATDGGSLVPGGIASAIEALLEAIYNLTESSAGKYTRKIFPLFATIVLMVLVANLLSLFPGVDSIGVVEHMDHGYPIQQLVPGVYAIVAGEAAHGEEYHIAPFVRALATDLNFTLGLALISVAMTQVIGFQANGPGFLFRYLNVRTLFSKPGFGAIDLGVSILELIAEFSKLLSFSFRLFGNIFAGAVLLFLIGSMIPYFAQTLVLLFKFFIGVIQALVFGMLTMVFMAQATRGHGEEEH
jgi:F-type H+-transporting ATPase subunit a